jgi:predicted  nucleic acid-binding Zn-ribbon protein
MSKESLCENLKKLVQCDNRIFAIKKSINKTQKMLEKNYIAIKKLDESLQEKQKQCRIEKKAVDLAELQASELKQLEESKKKVLEGISNVVEYEAIEKELLNITNKIMKQDDILISVWSKFNAAEKLYETTKAFSEKRKLALEEEITQKNEEIKELREQFIAEEKQRPQLAAAIPSEWINQYERMKNTVFDPIVPVLQNSCSACYYIILLQDLSKLKKSGILLCRNCYRFLYYDPEEEKNSTKATF